MGSTLQTSSVPLFCVCAFASLQVVFTASKSLDVLLFHVYAALPCFQLSVALYSSAFFFMPVFSFRKNLSTALHLSSTYGSCTVFCFFIRFSQYSLITSVGTCLKMFEFVVQFIRQVSSFLARIIFIYLFK